MKPPKIAQGSSKNIRGEFRGDSHVSHSSMGMGDYYGTGFTAKLGKMREGTGMQFLSPKKLKQPPRSVV